MKIIKTADGAVEIEMESPEEARDLAFDLDEAAIEPGYNVVSSLINDEGVTTLTVRVGPRVG